MSIISTSSQNFRQCFGVDIVVNQIVYHLDYRSVIALKRSCKTAFNTIGRLFEEDDEFLRDACLLEHLVEANEFRMIIRFMQTHSLTITTEPHGKDFRNLYKSLRSLAPDINTADDMLVSPDFLCTMCSSQPVSQYVPNDESHRYCDHCAELMIHSPSVGLPRSLQRLSLTKDDVGLEPLTCSCCSLRPAPFRVRDLDLCTTCLQNRPYLLICYLSQSQTHRQVGKAPRVPSIMPSGSAKWLSESRRQIWQRMASNQEARPSIIFQSMYYKNGRPCLFRKKVSL